MTHVHEDESAPKSAFLKGKTFAPEFILGLNVKPQGIFEGWYLASKFEALLTYHVEKVKIER